VDISQLFLLFPILFWLVIIGLIIGLIVIMFRNSKMKNDQLKRVEEKVDKILEQLDKK
jgi:uncharacterized membrane-anchored protein YhcB (DUF1043 family)